MYRLPTYFKMENQISHQVRHQTRSNLAAPLSNVVKERGYTCAKIRGQMHSETLFPLNTWYRSVLKSKKLDQLYHIDKELTLLKNFLYFKLKPNLYKPFKERFKASFFKKINNELLFNLPKFNPSYNPLRRRQWHPTPVLLPGKSHGRRSLVGCSLWGR